MKWTPSRVELLKSRLKRRWKTAEIADSFGISANAVSKKAHSLGLSLVDGSDLPARNKKSKAKPATRREHMDERPRMITMSEPATNPSTDVPAPTDPSQLPPAEDATKPVTREELRKGGLKMWGPNPR